MEQRNDGCSVEDFLGEAIVSLERDYSAPACSLMRLEGPFYARKIRQFLKIRRAPETNARQAEPRIVSIGGCP